MECICKTKVGYKQGSKLMCGFLLENKVYPSVCSQVNAVFWSLNCDFLNAQSHSHWFSTHVVYAL